MTKLPEIDPALHEAAHVVVGLALGTPLEYVTIVPNPGLHIDNAGTTQWVPDVGTLLRNQIIEAWAALALGDTEEACAGDLERLRRVEAEGWSWGLIESLREEAIELVDEYYADILLLAEALREKLTLTGREVAAILARETMGPDVAWTRGGRRVLASAYEPCRIPTVVK